jgi:hypothetical protein
MKARALRIGGLAAGMAVAALLVTAFRVPAESGALGAGVRLIAAAPGELEASPSGTLLSARRLLPGRSAESTVRLRNVTGSDLCVRLRGLPAGRDLDRIVRLELRGPGGRPLARGPLGRFRHWTPPFRLRRAESTRLSARVWIPTSVRTGFEGRDVDVTVEMRARPR